MHGITRIWMNLIYWIINCSVCNDVILLPCSIISHFVWASSTIPSSYCCASTESCVNCCMLCSTVQLSENIWSSFLTFNYSFFHLWQLIEEVKVRSLPFEIGCLLSIYVWLRGWAVRTCGSSGKGCWATSLEIAICLVNVRHLIMESGVSIQTKGILWVSGRHMTCRAAESTGCQVFLTWTSGVSWNDRSIRVRLFFSSALVEIMVQCSVTLLSCLMYSS